ASKEVAAHRHDVVVDFVDIQRDHFAQDVLRTVVDADADDGRFGSQHRPVEHHRARLASRLTLRRNATDRHGPTILRHDDGLLLASCSTHVPREALHWRKQNYDGPSPVGTSYADWGR